LVQWAVSFLCRCVRNKLASLSIGVEHTKSSFIVYCGLFIHIEDPVRKLAFEEELGIFRLLNISIEPISKSRVLLFTNSKGKMNPKAFCYMEPAQFLAIGIIVNLRGNPHTTLVDLLIPN